MRGNSHSPYISGFMPPAVESPNKLGNSPPATATAGCAICFFNSCQHPTDFMTHSFSRKNTKSVGSRRDGKNGFMGSWRGTRDTGGIQGDMERYERHWWHPMEGWQTEKMAFWDFFREKRSESILKKKYRVLPQQRKEETTRASSIKDTRWSESSV